MESDDEQRYMAWVQTVRLDAELSSMILSSTGFLSRIGVLLTLGGLLLLNSAYHVSYVYAFLALGAFTGKGVTVLE